MFGNIQEWTAGLLKAYKEIRRAAARITAEDTRLCAVWAPDTRMPRQAVFGSDPPISQTTWLTSDAAAQRMQLRKKLLRASQRSEILGSGSSRQSTRRMKHFR